MFDESPAVSGDLCAWIDKITAPFDVIGALAQLAATNMHC